MTLGATRRIDRKAFITGPKTAERVQRLNTAVLDCEILPVVGETGTGKDRFLDWWWQQGCANAKFAGDMPINSDDIVLIRARAAQSTTIPVACFLMNALWHALLEGQRAREHGEPTRAVHHLRALKTESHLVSLIDHAIAPLLDMLDPLAIVVLDAQLLDSTSINWLLDLRTPLRRGQPLIAERALMLCGTEDVHAKTLGRIGKLMDKTEELRQAWYRRLVFERMHTEVTSDEFDRIMVRLIRHNLDAVFSDEASAAPYLEEFAAWTTTNWHLIDELANMLDRCLGPRREDGPRRLTEPVMACVREQWLKRTQ